MLMHYINVLQRADSFSDLVSSFSDLVQEKRRGVVLKKMGMGGK